ncbi:YcaO-like family protein [Lactiplantibacillus argentoratensis]|uniref:YcaO-like family protein n=2 Tax=Lactobacillaceae TaxID=33958 RepID=UPI003EB6CAD9
MISICKEKTTDNGYEKFGFHNSPLSKKIFNVLRQLSKNQKVQIQQKEIYGTYITEINFKPANGYLVSSNGIAINKAMSLLAASYEFIERYMGSIHNTALKKEVLNGHLLGQKTIDGLSVNSNGLAIANSFLESKVFSLLELIERDTFLNYWYLKKKPKIVDSSTALENNKYYKYLRKSGYSIRILSLQNEFNVEIVWVLITANSDKQVFSSYTTTGCSFTFKSAVNSALKEAFYGVATYTNKAAILDIGKNALKHGPQIISDHPCIYALPQMLSNFDFVKNINCINKKYTNDLISVNIGNWYQEQMKYISQKGWNINSYSLETKSLRNKGLYVTRTEIPELQSLVFGKDSLSKINFKRLRSVSTKSPSEFSLHPYT